MGLILDTSVLSAGERGAAALDFSRWEHLGDAFISTVTVSELLAGVHLADTERRRLKRLAFVEGFLASIPALDFTPEVARVHAEVFAFLWRKGGMIGAHDLIIATTALAHGHAVLTENTGDFRRVPALEVLSP